MTRPAPGRRRPGFTLIELLVVLAIIAILIALLVPAVLGAVRRARSAAVQAEINMLAQALASFQTKYGDYPPSRVVLDEGGWLPTSSLPVPSGGPSSGTTDISVNQLSIRTLTAFRKFWPRVAMSTSSSVGTSTSWYDFNGNGTADFSNQNSTPFVLQGHECLVFFLGGIPLSANGRIAMIGFGTSPTNPFSNGVLGSSMYSTNRNKPFYDFDSSRLVLTRAYQTTSPAYNTTYTSSGNPGFLDSLASQGAATATASNAQNFYAYFSTNNGSGYDPNDVNFENPNYEADANTLHPLLLGFTTVQPAFNSGGSQVTTVVSASPNPYTTTLPAPTGGATAQRPVFVNAQSFQILSPGLDGIYGIGGAYVANSGTVLPPENALSNSTDPNVRVSEKDNLTNFHNGQLD